MKTLVLAALALVLTVMTVVQSQAQVGPNPRPPGRNELDPFPCRFRPCMPGDRPGDRWPDDRDYPNRGKVACAPEVVDGNVKATDRTLKTLAASSDFATAKTFKAQVSKISAQDSAGVKADQYLALAGIDSKDSEAVVEFIGAREVKGQWLNALEKNSNLSSSQAETVAKQLQTVLRGGLQ